jgi:hypothetical protein
VSQILPPPACPASPRVPAQGAGRRWQQDESEDHGQVLDDKPTHRDPARARVQYPALLQGTQQHDRAGDGERQTEHQPRAQRPAPQHRDAGSQGGRNGDLPKSAGNGDPAHRHQIADREVQADPEHQEDHANLGELIRQFLIADIAGRERPDGDAGEQITDQRRQSDLGRNESAGKGHHEAYDDRRDQLRLVVHRLSRSRLRGSWLRRPAVAAIH